MLTPEQEKVLDVLLRRRQNVFLTGVAGSGKTLILREALKAFRQRKEEVAVCSPTGMSAQHLGGITLAKLLGLRLAKSLRDIEKVSLRQAEENLHRVETIIIDEISLASGDLLCLVEAVLCEVGNPDLPFGGFRMIFSGDFCQLPPVWDKEQQLPPEFPLAFEHPGFAEVLVLALGESQRQQAAGDQQLLAEFRQGKISPAGKKSLEAMAQRSFPDALHLFPRKQDAWDHNHQKLRGMKGQLYQYPTQVFGCSFAEAANQIPVPEKVLLKVGAPVIILANDPESQYVNGSRGVVREIFLARAKIELPTGQVVSVPWKTWEIRNLREEVIGSVEGMPLQLGWAATIHRAQGMTLDKVAIDLSRCWEPGQAYVALSRTRSLQDIAISQIPNQIQADPVVLAYTNSLL